MGTYGMGNAFDRRYVQRSCVPQQHVRFQPPSQSGTVVINKTYNCGIPMMGEFQQPKTNWLAFALGTVGGFFGAKTNYSTNMNCNMGVTPQPTAGSTNYLANLKSLYPNFNIVDDGNGQFRATDKNGKSYGPADYNTMCNLLSASKADESQGAGGAGEPKGTGSAGSSGKSGGTGGAGEAKGAGGSGTGVEDDGSNDDAATVNHDGWTNVTKDDVSKLNGKNLAVHDHERGAQYDVTGQCKISDDKTSDGFPKTITVGQYTYTYQRTDGGEAIYKSTTNGTAGDEYRLEKDSSGNFGLRQYSGDKGAGTVDISSHKTNRGG